MSIIHCCGICLITEESSDEIVVHNRKSTRPGTTFSKVYVFGREVQLTQLESEILEFLMLKSGDFVTRNQILDHLGDDGDVMFRSVDSMIKRLRAKLFPSNVWARHIFIQTIYSKGYRIYSRK